MKRKKLFAQLFLAVIFVFASSGAAFAATYSDTSGHWAESAIEDWSGHGVIIGSDGLFRPDDSITRGEMAIIIQRIMQYKESSQNTFSDLESDKWYTEPVLKANAAGVILGYEDLVRPTDTISREEAIVMICRAFGLDRLVASGSTPFHDSGNIASWASNEVGLMSDYGYLSWAGDYFSPQQAITRAEIIATMDKAVKKMWRSDGLYTNVIEGTTVVSAGKAYLVNCYFNGNIIIGGGAEHVVIDNCVVNGQIIVLNNANVQHVQQNSGEVSAFFFGKNDITIDFSVPKNTYNASYFQHANGRVTYNEPNVATRSGIDISEHQATIDWSQVANDGIEFAIIRLGYRGYETGIAKLDICYHDNMRGAIGVGLDVGVYFFSQAISVAEAVEEANMCIEYLRDYDISYPVVFDWETVNSAAARTNNISGSLLTDCALAFCETIENAGYDAMIYANKELSVTTLNRGCLTDYPFWFAGYTTYPEYYYGFDIWQYSSSGSVAGITTKVDMNIEFLK